MAARTHERHEAAPDDGRGEEPLGDHAGDRAEWLLDSPDVGLWIPPSLWGEQRYLSNPVGLMVLCDRPYEADDYIRDYDAYIRYRSGAE